MQSELQARAPAGFGIGRAIGGSKCPNSKPGDDKGGPCFRLSAMQESVGLEKLKDEGGRLRQKSIATLGSRFLSPSRISRSPDLHGGKEVLDQG